MPSTPKVLSSPTSSPDELFSKAPVKIYPEGRQEGRSVKLSKRKLDFGKELKEIPPPPPKRFKFTAEMDVVVYAYD